jgi:transcriptional regulator with XRE-family HTH domain
VKLKSKKQFKFGEKIRTVRERRSLTLREVAGQAGVSESLVSQIERNRVSPALDTLLAIADVLNLDLEYLFSDYRRDRPVQVVRKKERDSFTRRPGVLYERLAQVDDGKHVGIEAYMISIAPGANTAGTEYGHQGWELGVIKSGRAEIQVGNSKNVLKPGDSISFRSDSPHVLSNPGKDMLRVFWIVTPPKGMDG